MISRQYFELKGELLSIITDWKHNVFDPHYAKIKQVLGKEFGTTRAMLSSWFYGRGISAVGDEGAPIEGMIPSKKNPTYLIPGKTKAGKAKAAILKDLGYPSDCEELLMRLEVFQKEWQVDDYLVKASITWYGDRFFVSVPVDYVPENWLTNPDLQPMYPHEMKKIKEAAESITPT